jgi:RNA polymerase sigma-70 factor (ECF subfamily)
VATRLRSEAPEAAAESQNEQQRLVEAIRTLPEDRQQLLLLKFVDRLSNQEIGEIMNRSEGAIKSLYHRTLLALREALSEPSGAFDRPAKPDERP